jgi:mRNA interferase MazF
MEKDFDRWNKLKKAINAADEIERVYFHEGDIWWARLGVNVGFEIDGKHRQFARPVIVLKKYNQYSFLALPLTTATRANRWRIPIGEVAGKNAFAVLSQLRNLDSVRLYQKIAHVDAGFLTRIKETASRMNFG